MIREVVLSERLSDFCEKEARARFERWKSRDEHKYRNHTLHRQRSGLLGEAGVRNWLHLWLYPRGIRVRWPRSDTLPDLLVFFRGEWHGIEVKTWQSHNWSRLGRCLVPKQAKTLRRHLAVVWATCTLGSPRIQIRGWTDPRAVDFSSTRRTGKDRVRNVQLDESELLDPGTLVDLLSEGEGIPA